MLFSLFTVKYHSNEEDSVDTVRSTYTSHNDVMFVTCLRAWLVPRPEEDTTQVQRIGCLTSQPSLRDNCTGLEFDTYNYTLYKINQELQYLNHLPGRLLNVHLQDMKYDVNQGENLVAPDDTCWQMFAHRRENVLNLITTIRLFYELGDSVHEEIGCKDFCPCWKEDPGLIWSGVGEPVTQLVERAQLWLAQQTHRRVVGVQTLECEVEPVKCSCSSTQLPDPQSCLKQIHRGSTFYSLTMLRVHYAESAVANAPSIRVNPIRLMKQNVLCPSQLRAGNPCGEPIFEDMRDVFTRAEHWAGGCNAHVLSVQTIPVPAKTGLFKASLVYDPDASYRQEKVGWFSQRYINLLRIFYQEKSKHNITNTSIPPSSCSGGHENKGYSTDQESQSIVNMTNSDECEQSDLQGAHTFSETPSVDNEKCFTGGETSEHSIQCEQSIQSEQNIKSEQSIQVEQSVQCEQSIQPDTSRCSKSELDNAERSMNEDSEKNDTKHDYQNIPKVQLRHNHDNDSDHSDSLVYYNSDNTQSNGEDNIATQECVAYIAPRFVILDNETRNCQSNNSMPSTSFIDTLPSKLSEHTDVTPEQSSETLIVTGQDNAYNMCSLEVGKDDVTQVVEFDKSDDSVENDVNHDYQNIPKGQPRSDDSQYSDTEYYDIDNSQRITDEKVPLYVECETRTSQANNNMTSKSFDDTHSSELSEHSDGSSEQSNDNFMGNEQNNSHMCSLKNGNDDEVEHELYLDGRKKQHFASEENKEINSDDDLTYEPSMYSVSLEESTNSEAEDCVSSCQETVTLTAESTHNKIDDSRESEFKNGGQSRDEQSVTEHFQARDDLLAKVEESLRETERESSTSFHHWAYHWITSKYTSYRRINLKHTTRWRNNNGNDISQVSDVVSKGNQHENLWNKWYKFFFKLLIYLWSRLFYCSINKYFACNYDINF